MKDYYSINEFSRLSGVEASTLRYWDSIGLFSPLKRDPASGYRYYSLAQITMLNFVSTLSDIGIPLKTIAELRSDRDPERFLRLLEKEDRQLDIELHKLQARAAIIHTKQELIRYGLSIDETEIREVYRDVEWTATLWPRNEYNEDDTFIEPLTKFVNQAEQYRINLGFPIGGRYDSMQTFIQSPGRPDNFFSIDPNGANTRRRGDYIVGFTRGYYGELGDLPERMEQYLKDHNLKAPGSVYLTYPHDEACYKDDDQYLAQVMIAVVKPPRRMK